MPLDVMWPLTQRWYGDRLDADVRPRSPAEHQQLLGDAGLTGDFWRLDPAAGRS